MRILDRFFRAKKRSPDRPEVTLITEQLTSDIGLFSSVRGRSALLKPGAAVVMNHLYETFVTKDMSTIADRRGIIAVVKIKDLACYEQVSLIQAEDLRGPAGGAIVHSLAAQAATELLRQAASEARAGMFPRQHGPRDH